MGRNLSMIDSKSSPACDGDGWIAMSTEPVAVEGRHGVALGRDELEGVK